MPTLSIKDYLYLTLLIALVSGFFAWSVHERHIGRDAIVAADQRTALVAIAKDKAIEAAAQTKTDTIYEKFNVPIPAVADLGIVCVAPRSGRVPEATDHKPGTDSTPDGGAGHTYDPSGEALTRAAEADKQIMALDAQIQVLVDSMNGAQK